MSRPFYPGRHFLQIPGPTNVLDRVFRATAAPTIGHRGSDFGALAKEVLAGPQRVIQTSGPVVVYPSSGTGAWEASSVNTLSPGDKVLMFEIGHFATLWKGIADRIGLAVDFVPGDWRSGVDPAVVKAKRATDCDRTIKAVCVVHNETSPGVTRRIPQIREARNRAKHLALLLVDTISSLGSIEYQHEAWGVGVTVGCSQKGLMLPPGLRLNVISSKALAATKSARCPRAYWDWTPMLQDNRTDPSPTLPPPTSSTVFGRPSPCWRRRGWHGSVPGTSGRGRRRVGPSGLGGWKSSAPTLPSTARRSRRSSCPTGTTPTPSGRPSWTGSTCRWARAWENSKVRSFASDTSGGLNDLTLAGTLCGVEMGLAIAGVPYQKGGVQAALDYLAAHT